METSTPFVELSRNSPPAKLIFIENTGQFFSPGTRVPVAEAFIGHPDAELSILGIVPPGNPPCQSKNRKVRVKESEL
jgi:hypothetical protein